MKKNKRTYKIAPLIAAFIMAVSLLWLTVSLPFVYKAQQINWCLAEEDSSENPYGDTTEEKAPTASVSEEYLHDHSEILSLFSSKLGHDHRHAYDIYVAFHGELISPPPDLLFS